MTGPNPQEGGKHTPGQGLMARATIHQLVAAKDQAREAYLNAFDALDLAHSLERAAAPSGRAGDLPWIGCGSAYGRNHEVFSEREKFEARVTRALDQNVWDHVIKTTNLDQLMDRQERDAFRAALTDDPPPATVENIAATVERLVGDSDLIFKRGIALAFAKLDRRFRSHDGFKLGSRIILSHAMSEWGSWSRGMDDVLVDVERAFCRLDGKPQPERLGGIVGQIDLARREHGGWGRRAAFEVRSDYYKANVYLNGNIHLWFARKDLVEKVNLLLADYYGANLGAAPDVADVKHAYATTPATSGGGFGLFPSPEPVVAAVMERAGLRKAAQVRGYDGSIPETYLKPKRVLEPSAGTGALSTWAADCLGASVTCVEVQAHLAAALAASGRYGRVVHADFLARFPGDLGRFDVIVMNPPFDGCRDVDHVTHALQFLAEGGVLVSVMGAGVEFRTDRKTADFRKEIERRGGSFFDLPPGSFAESGTYINTVLCCIGRRYWS